MLHCLFISLKISFPFSKLKITLKIIKKESLKIIKKEKKDKKQSFLLFLFFPRFSNFIIGVTCIPISNVNFSFFEISLVFFSFQNLILRFFTEPMIIHLTWYYMIICHHGKKAVETMNKSVTSYDLISFNKSNNTSESCQNKF